MKTFSYSNSVLSEPLTAFLDAVTNPFGATRPCQVPDGYNHHTMCLTDWIDALSISINCPTLANISGVAFYFMVGQNELTDDLDNVGTNGDPLYCVVVMPIDSNGIIQTNNAATGLSVLLSANYAQISGDAYGHVSSNALVTCLRLFGAGLRLWPTIEMITSSDTLAVTNYYGGLMCPEDIHKCVNDGSNFYNILRQSEYISEFTNSQGITTRMDPFGLENYMTMRSLDNWGNINNFDTSLMNFPIVVARFTQTVNNGDIAPIKFMSQYWLEGQLVQPTPLFASQNPFDLEYGTITKIVSHSPDVYPFVVQGHSFKSFLKNVGRVSKLVATTANVSSKLLPQRYANIATKVAKVATNVNQATQSKKALKRAAVKVLKKASKKALKKAQKDQLLEKVIELP